MLAFAARRIAQLIPTMLVVTVLTFLLLRLAPGNPASVLLGPLATPSAIAHVQSELGLNRPIYVQYILWLWRLARLDFGTSYVNFVPAGPYVFGKLLNSLLLIGVALVISSAIGISVGLVGALRMGGAMDRGVTTATLLGLCFPDFWIGLMLILVFAATLHFLPPGGMVSIISPSSWQIPSHIVLPAVSLAAGTAAVMARVARSAIGDALGQGYVLAARSRGASRARVTIVHGLRNGLIPIITLLGIQFGFLLGGDIVIEYVFSWPGVGNTLLNAVQQKDYSVVEASVFMIALTYMVATVLIDFAYYAIDPRVRNSLVRR